MLTDGVSCWAAASLALCGLACLGVPCAALAWRRRRRRRLPSSSTPGWLSTPASRAAPAPAAPGSRATHAHWRQQALTLPAKSGANADRIAFPLCTRNIALQQQRRSSASQLRRRILGQLGPASLPFISANSPMALRCEGGQHWRRFGPCQLPNALAVGMGRSPAPSATQARTRRLLSRCGL